jgi:hypothetical protein
MTRKGRSNKAVEKAKRRKIRRRRNPSLTHGDVTQAVLDVCKYVQSYGMAVIGVNADIHWLDNGSVTCCGHIRTAARTAGQAVVKHALKHNDTRSLNKMIDLLIKANLYY